MRPVTGSRRVSSPEDGATQSVSPRAASAPELPGTTVPIRTVRSITSNCGSIRLTETNVAVGLERTTHTPPPAAAIPVGGSPTVSVPTSRSALGSTREIV